MNRKKRGKMPIEERAKQFAPFSALRGLPEALVKMERVLVPRKELSEERMEELNQALQQIERGDIVTVVYYTEGVYAKITGKITRLDVREKTLQILNTTVLFDMLYSINLEEARSVAN